jgi:radical SAM superfamily enzyme YgiQ (UPF0313 family)
VDALMDAVSYPRYEGDVYRPPSEADSLILQVMYGCSHGDCRFCGMYTGKRFRVRPSAEVAEDIERLAPWLKEKVRKVFLCDGDALVLPTRSLVSILDLLGQHLPRLERVSAYANSHSLLRKSGEDLGELREHGLGMLYVGLESGDEETLAAMGKGVTVAEQIEGCRKAKQAGMALSVMAILGLGGVERSLEHARGTARAFSEIDPEYISMLSLMLAPGAQLANAVRRGEFEVPDALTVLGELREIIAGTDVTDAVFRTTHASNYLPLEGRLPADRSKMLEVLDRVLAMGAEAPLRPEYLRGL